MELSLFYDYNEYTTGEGFYPQLSVPKCERFSSKYILFKLENNIFYQYSGPAISGFYENHGTEILKELIKLFAVNASTCVDTIINYGGRIVHPTIYEYSTFKIITKKRCFTF